MSKKSEDQSNAPLQFRQGDIFFEQLPEVPKGFRYDPSRNMEGRIVLAEGEVTGHFHEIAEDLDTVVLAPEDTAAIDDLILHVRRPEGATVTHPEHGPITLPPGLWKVGRQREYEHGSITREEQERARRVAD